MRENLNELAMRLRAIAAEIEAASAGTDDHTPHPAKGAAVAARVNTSLRLEPSMYFAESQPKDMAVLHFTAGTTAEGAVTHWRQSGQRVGTAYVIGLDGTVYEVFPPDCWAYHLGITRIHGTEHDKRSIGIELVNVGPLRRKGDDLFWWPDGYGRRYCSVRDASLYVQALWRGEQYFAAFTDAQYNALISLLLDLAGRFRFPLNLPSPSERTLCDPGRFFSRWRGVASHQNFRADKFDIGPAFDWDRIRL